MSGTESIDTTYSLYPTDRIGHQVQSHMKASVHRIALNQLRDEEIWRLLALPFRTPTYLIQPSNLLQASD